MTFKHVVKTMRRRKKKEQWWWLCQLQFFSCCKEERRTLLSEIEKIITIELFFSPSPFFHEFLERKNHLLKIFLLSHFYCVIFIRRTKKESRNLEKPLSDWPNCRTRVKFLEITLHFLLHHEEKFLLRRGIYVWGWILFRGWKR